MSRTPQMQPPAPNDKSGIGAGAIVKRVGRQRTRPLDPPPCIGLIFTHLLPPARTAPLPLPSHFAGENPPPGPTGPDPNRR